MLNPGTWLARHAPGYANLARFERRALEDFVLLWSLFEAQVMGADANVPKLLHLVDALEERGWAGDTRLTPAWDHFRNRLCEESELNFRFHGLGIQNPAHTELTAAALMSENAPDPIKLKALLIIVYRIRNNLLHGEKWAYGIADQSANFQHASQVLMISLESHGV